MNRSNASTSWRDLDVAQLHTWSDAPRRMLLVLLVFAAFGFMGWYVLAPKYTQWQHEKTSNETLQRQYTELVSLKPQVSSVLPNPIHSSELPIALTRLATEARAFHLRAFQVKPIVLPSEFNDGGTSTHRQNMVSVRLHVQGDYLNIIQYYAKLLTVLPIFSMDEMVFNSIDEHHVGAQVRISLMQQGLP